jgi:hypothetical protein
VTARSTRWHGAIARAVLLAVTTALVPVPAMAAETKPAPTTKTLQASMRAAVAREVAKTPAVRSAKPAQQNDPSTASGNFFKTGPGIAALVVLGAGAGYAIYSASHDRIHSPAKK